MGDDVVQVQPAQAQPTPVQGRRPRLWPNKALYFILFAATGVYGTFINVYYASTGLSGTQIGLVNTVAPAVGMFSGPLWGLLSDRTGRTRLLLITAVLGVVVTSQLVSLAQTYVLLLGAVAAYALFNAPITPLVDSATLEALGEQRERYGAQRVWGSIGFIITSAVIGLLLERLGLRFIFVAYAAIMACVIVVLALIPARPVHLRGAVLRGVGQMMHSPPWLLFAGSIWLLGLAASGMNNFLSVMMRHMGAADGLIGITWTVAAVTELPVMTFGAVLLRRVGARRLLAFAMCVYGVRMVLYSLMPSPVWAVWIGLLGGLSFGVYWISAVTYANELAPADLKATSQGLLVSVTSLSGIAGATLTGWLFDAVGPWMMFRILAGFCALALALFGAGRLAAMTRRQSASRPS